MSLLAAGPQRRRIVTIILAFAALYIIWGTTYLGIRVAVETMPPFFMAAARFLLAGALMFGFLRLRGAPLPSRQHWRAAALIGAFLVLGGNGLVTWAEQRVPSSVAALVVATMPIWMTLFDWLIYRRTQPTKRIALGLVLGTLGIALLVGPGLSAGEGGVRLVDWLLLMAAPILWALGSLQSRQVNLPDNAFMSTAMQMLSGGVLLLLAGLLTGEVAQVDLAAISTRSFVSFVYLTIFGSIVAFTAYIWLLKHVDAPKVATYTYVNPVIAVLLGWLLLDETITPQMLVAVTVIIAGVMFITLPQGKAKRAETEAAAPPLADAACEGC